jgi:sulfoxide reductase heme-binding subunit YedZ
VHRTTSLTALLFVALHVITLMADPYAQLRLLDAVVPFAGTYRPLWQGLGTVAIDLIGLLVVSSLLRQHVGLKVWRALHWAAYLCWPVAILHAFGNGTDDRSRWMLIVLASCVGAVGTAGAWRLLGRDFAPEAAPPSVSPPSDLAGLS